MHSETVHIDFETRSPLPFGRPKEAVNVYVYAAHDCTDLWCAQIAVGDDDPVLWLPYEPLPKAIENHLKAGAPRCAHNAQFERVIWQRICTPRYDWPETEIEHWDCTMARSLSMALPASLDGAAAAVGLDVRKDHAGHRLMMQMAKPRRIIESSGAIEWWDDEEKRLQLYEYCRQDVIVERRLDQELFRLSPFERRVYNLDQRMNDRGVYIDAEARAAANYVVDELTADADAEMETVTGGAVRRATQVAALQGWASRRLEETEIDRAMRTGCTPDFKSAKIDSLAADKIDDLLGQDLPGDVEQALTLRKAVAKTSTSKLAAFERHADADGRVRGTYQYCGAGRTSRWAGRGIQPQNLPRPSPEMEDPEAVETAFNIMVQRDADAMSMLYGNPMSTVADCLRGIIRPGPGKQFDCADFSNIEGRVTAWLVGEEWKLDAFRAYDAGVGPDLYLVAAGKIFGLDPKEAKPHRQIGKVAELALGYQGGANAFATMAKTYGLKIGEHYDTIWSVIPPAMREEIGEAWEDYGRLMRMEERSWKAAEAVKRPWRIAHPKLWHTYEDGDFTRVGGFWVDIEQVAKNAIMFPGEAFQCGRLTFRMAGSFLCCRLPSNHVIFYAYPEIRLKKTPWGKEKDTIFYKGVDSYTKKWTWFSTYGGKLLENAVQAIARDILAYVMLLVDPKYPIVMTSHDELVSETPKGFGSHAEYVELMSVRPDWLDAFPLSVAGWRGDRYRK